MIFGVAILLMNQMSLKSRKNYTTVTGKSGQISKINLGKVGKYLIAVIPDRHHLLHQYFPNPVLRTGDFPSESGRLQFPVHHGFQRATTKWWLTDNNGAGALYGQPGILHNPLIWRAFK